MKLLEKYYRIKEIAGIDIHLGRGGSATYDVCILKASGDTLEIDKKLPGLSSDEDLKKHIPAKSSVAINISGKGILYKDLEKTGEITQTIFNNLLPNARIEEYYLQNFVSGNKSFVAIIRKTDADKWINRLQEQGFQAICLSLGPFVVDQIVTQLNIYAENLVFAGYHISRNENTEWTGFRSDETSFAEFPLKIASETIPEQVLIPYAAAFQVILAEFLDRTGVQSSPLEPLFRKKISDNKLKIQGAIIGTTFFALLFINFILFTSLNSFNADLDTKLSILSQTTNNQQEISQQVVKKEARLQLLGWDGGIDKSLLIDQISSLMPPDITLSEIQVDPLDLANTRLKKTPVFSSRTIRIAGFSEKVITVNEWIARIKTKSWVKHVQIENYFFNRDKRTGEFSIILNN